MTPLMVGGAHGELSSAGQVMAGGLGLKPRKISTVIYKAQNCENQLHSKL